MTQPEHYEPRSHDELRIAAKCLTLIQPNYLDAGWYRRISFENGRYEHSGGTSHVWALGPPPNPAMENWIRRRGVLGGGSQYGKVGYLACARSLRQETHRSPGYWVGQVGVTHHPHGRG